MMKEPNDFLHNLRKLIDDEIVGEGVSGTEDGTMGTSEEFSEELMVMDLDELTPERLDLLTEMGVIRWVSAEDVKHAESTVEDEIDFEQGNTSDTPTEMLKSEPREDGGYTVSFASEKGAHAIVTVEDEQSRSIYAVGETVVTVNPYTHEFVYEDADGTPLYFVITSIAWDAGDETFRYLIEGEEEWVSEEWLDKPMVSMMSKIFVEINTGEDGEVTTKVKPPKKTGLQTELDEMLDELAINTYLEMMGSDNESTREHAIRMLHKIAEKRESKTGEAQ